MPDSKDRFRALATSNSPSKSVPDAQSSEAPTDVEHSKVGPEKHNGNHSIGEESDYDPLEDRRLLRRSRRQLWVWRCVSYLLLAALIGEGLLPVMQHISAVIALYFGGRFTGKSSSARRELLRIFAWVPRCFCLSHKPEMTSLARPR